MDIFRYIEKGEVQRSRDDTLLSKHRPQRLTDLICSDMAVLCLNQWFRKFRKREADRKPLLMISGPSGVGKSTMASLALSEHGYARELTVCCTALRVRKDVTTVLQDLVNDGTMGVVVDNVDVADGACLSAIQEAASSPAASMVPFVFVCERHEYGRPTDISKNCEIIALRHPSKAKVCAWAKSVAKSEGIGASDATLSEIVEKARGDLRNVLMTLDLNRSGGSFVADQKDSNMDAIEITRHLFSPESAGDTSESIRMVHTDFNIITSMVSENYLDLDDAASADAIARAADAISHSDVVETRIFADQQWDLWDEYAMFGAVYPASQVRSGARLNEVRFTRSWSRISNMYLRKSILRQLRTGLRKVEGVLTVDLDYLYGLSSVLATTFQADTGRLVSLAGRSIPYETVLFVLRICMGAGLKQTMINRIRKEYEARGYKERPGKKLPS
jgi:DNA polymerase III delta prime subunit